MFFLIVPPVPLVVAAYVVAESVKTGIVLWWMMPWNR